MKRNCRILYLIGQLGPGGQERQLCYLLQAVDRERYLPAVAVWSFCQDDRYVSDIRALGVPIYSLGRNGNVFGKLQAFGRLVKTVKPEIAHSYCFWTNFAVYLGSQSSQAIAIGSMRGGFPYEKDRFDPFTGNVNSFWPRTQIFNSLTAAENAKRSRSPFLPRDIQVVRNGLDLGHFSTVPFPKGQRTRIVGVGSLVPVKRWDQVLRAAGILKRQGLNYLLQIAGDGPLRDVLMRQIQDLGLAGDVEFVGYKHNIDHLIACATFLVHTSESEGCPNAVMEAMASGRPVVATKVGDVPYLVKNGETGFVVEFGDDAALVDRMTRLITNRELAEKMGKLARTKAEQDFGLDSLASNTLAAYRAAGWAG